MAIYILECLGGLLISCIKLQSAIFFTSCCCCWYCPPLREVCPNYEVVELQPRTLTTPYLGSVSYCCVHLLTRTTLPYCCPMSRLPRFLLPSCLCTVSSAHPGFTRPRPSIPRKLLPIPYPPVTTIVWLFRPSLALTTPTIFLLPLLPRWFRDLF